jgi:hypothetical protein
MSRCRYPKPKHMTIPKGATFIFTSETTFFYCLPEGIFVAKQDLVTKELYDRYYKQHRGQRINFDSIEFLSWMLRQELIEPIHNFIEWDAVNKRIEQRNTQHLNVVENERRITEDMEAYMNWAEEH